MSINMAPGQYMIGNTVLGPGTPYTISTVEIQSYNTNALDYAVNRSDEINFGQDSLQPTPVIFTMGVEDNFRIENMAGLTGKALPNIDVHKWALHNLQREWRADEVRGTWGTMKPMFCCERDGRVLMWPGRPRKFQYTKRSRKSQFFTVQAEFMRADVKAYSGDEYFEEILPNEPGTVSRVAGDDWTWFRILLYGPAVHPEIVGVTPDPMILDYNIADGELVEISSYPWVRRVISSEGFNVAATLNTYLDQLRLGAYSDTEIEWTATGTNENTKMLFCWRDAYSVMA